MPAITGFHHISLTVGDLDAAEAFYRDVFGFTRVLELADEGGRGAKRVLLHPDTFTVVGFTKHAAGSDDRFSEFRTGLDHLSFGVASRAELEAWIERLDELGVSHSEISTTKVGHLLTLRDPDGIALELWANP
jgi:glyoxylase I family protein